MRNESSGTVCERQAVVIYGLTSSLVFRLIRSINKTQFTYDIAGVVMNHGDSPEVDMKGYPLLGNAAVLPDLARRSGLKFFCNINRSPREMKEADDQLTALPVGMVNLVHPSIDLDDVSIVPDASVSLAEGCLVGPDAVLGRHVTCRMGVIVSHQVVLGDYVYVGPGATLCGNARLGSGCDVGAGSTILPKVSIGRNVIVGAGAVVTRDVPDNVTVVGVPARIVKQHAPDDPRFI